MGEEPPPAARATHPADAPENVGAMFDQLQSDDLVTIEAMKARRAPYEAAQLKKRMAFEAMLAQKKEVLRKLQAKEMSQAEYAPAIAAIKDQWDKDVIELDREIAEAKVKVDADINDEV